MKIKKFLLGLGLISICFGISSCSNKESHEKINATYEVEDLNAKTYTHNYVYSDSYFLSNSYNNDLAKASFALADATATFKKSKTKDENFKDYLGQIGYSNFYANPYLFEETKIDGIGVEIASKNVKLNGKNKTIVAVSVRGFGYDYEWVSNFIVGSKGDHEGFKAASLQVIDEIDSYVKKLQNKDVVLWISGYSRGGAVSNLTAAYLDNYSYYKKNNNWLMDECKNELSFDIDLDEIFCYTFEAPKGALDTNVKAIESITSNIHNITNESDLVTMVLPKELGFSIYGNTYNVLIDPSKDEFKDIGKALEINYDIEIYEYVASLTEIEGVNPIALGSFKIYPKKLDTKITTKDFIKGLINELVDSLKTRESYNLIVDPILKEVAYKFRSLSKDERKVVIDTLKEEFSKSSMLSFISSAGIKKIMKNSFAKVNVTISDETYKCIDSLYSIIINIVMSELSFDNEKIFKRTATFYMNMNLIIINHVPAFIAEFMEKI